MSDQAITVNGRKIGRGHEPFIVAEMSGNHNGDFGRAVAIMEAAKEAGADAVKLQTYTADTITIDHDGPGFRIEGGLWHGRTLYDLYTEAHTPWEWHERLFEKGRELGITVFSSPFDPSAVDFLEQLGNPLYKIASPEVIDLPLIEKVAATGKPVAMSTGMASYEEIREAVETARHAGCRGLVLLHCTSGYPTPHEESDLRTIPALVDAFGVIAGLSDHTQGTAVPVAATALGAAMIEKHLTLRRADGGPDAAFSLEPGELTELVTACRAAWLSLGRAGHDLKPSERGTVLFRRSLYIVADVQAGEVFTEKNVRSIRPGFGLPPKYLPQILGRRAVAAYKRGTPLRVSMVIPPLEL